MRRKGPWWCTTLYTPLYHPGYTPHVTGSAAEQCVGVRKKGPYRQGAYLDSCNNVPRPKIAAKLIVNLIFPAFGHVGYQSPNQLLFVLDRDLLATIRLLKSQVVRR